MQRSVDGGRDGATVFARDRVERVAERHRHLGPEFAHNCAHPLFVRGLHHRPEQADRDRVHRAALEVIDRRLHVVFRERCDLVAARVDPPSDFTRSVAGDEGLRIVEPPVEGALARCLAERQHVGVPCRADQPDRAGAAFHQRVSGDRGAVHDAPGAGEEVREIAVEGAGCETERVHEAPLERGWGGGRLDHREPRSVRDHAVGEGPADVDRDLILAHPPPQRLLLKGARILATGDPAAQGHLPADGLGAPRTPAQE